MSRELFPNKPESINYTANKDGDRILVRAFKLRCKRLGIPAREGLRRLMVAELNSDIREMGS